MKNKKQDDSFAIKDHEFDDGSIYTGYAKCNTRKYLNDSIKIFEHGRGKKVWKNGSKYEGEFSNGKPNGKGVFNSPHGDTYEGNFKDSLANGFGNFTQKDGTIFAGEWK